MIAECGGALRAWIDRHSRGRGGTETTVASRDMSMVEAYPLSVKARPASSYIS